MKTNYRRTLRNRKQRIKRRLNPKRAWGDQLRPMMSGCNVHYEMADKSRAVNCVTDPAAPFALLSKLWSVPSAR